MSFKTTKRKLRKLFNKVARGTSELIRKDKFPNIPLLNNTIMKTAKVLYDSDWINVPPFTGTLVEATINNENTLIETSSQIPTSVNATAQLGQEAPLEVDLFIKKALNNLPKRLLPYTKVSVIFNPLPNVKAKPIIDDYKIVEYQNDPYVEVKGDGAKIYDGLGFPDPDSEYLASELNGMGISSLKWSSIYEGKLSWTDGGTDVEIRNAWLDVINTTYDEVVVVAPDTTSRTNNKIFRTEATEYVTPTEVKGIGTLTENNWSFVDDGFGNAIWSLNTTVTKNVTVTAPLFESVTDFNYKRGDRYENGTFVAGGSSGFVSSNVFGDLALTSTFHTTSSSDSSDKYYHLWYSSKKAKRFKLTNANYFSDSNSYKLDNIPSISFYESLTLPYNNITVKVNPSPHPKKIQTDSAIVLTSRQETSPIWVDMQPTNEGDPDPISSIKHMMAMRGRYMFTTPAIKEQSDEAPFVDENWSAGASTFERDSENRDPKQILRYLPETTDLNMRIIITLNTPNVYYETFKTQVREDF